MKSRILTVLLCVLFLFAAVSFAATGSEGTAEKPFSLTFGNPSVNGNTVSFDVSLNNSSAGTLQASLVDVHLTVSGGTGASFTAKNSSGVTAETATDGSSLRLCREELQTPLTVPAATTTDGTATIGSVVLGTITVTGSAGATVSIGQTTTTTDADGITSPGSQYSLLGTVGTASYTFPTGGVTVSGQVKSWNPNNDLIVQLMQGTEVKNTITIAGTKTGSGQLTQAFSIPGVTAGTYDLVVTKPCHLTYTITGVQVGSENLDLTAATGKSYQTINMLVGDVDGDKNTNESDVSVIRYATNINKSTANAADKLADVDGDGFVNETDVSIVRFADYINKNTLNCTYSY